MNTETQAALAKPFSVEKFTVLLGVLKGEGIGAEVIAAALKVGEAAAERFGFELRIELGGAIGLEARRTGRSELSPEVMAFCSEIFRRGGSILSGPGGGRFVYDLRRHFQLFCKVNPLTSYPELDGISRLRPKMDKPRPDILLVRENLEGIYQGQTGVSSDASENRKLAHTFYCTEAGTRMLLEKSCRLAAGRSGRLAVIVKRGALAAISELWQDCAEEAARKAGVRCEVMDIDFAVYQLLQNPEDFDVMATPNCFGDILADAGGLLCGCRGLTYGASYSAEGFGVYQTNHGCAYDLAGTLRANPVGQILSLAMLLRESCQLPHVADAIVTGVRQVWSQGIRTADLQEPGSRVVATDVLADQIAEAVRDGKGCL